jgi:hypothetical protein
LTNSISAAELIKKNATRVTSLGDSRRQASQTIKHYQENRTECGLERFLDILHHHSIYKHLKADQDSAG